MHDPTTLLASGLLISDWRLEHHVATSPRSDVYRVNHQITNQTAILRLLPAGRSQDDLFRSRFFRECDLAAQVSAPEVARVLGWGDHAGRVWCVTEMLADGTLADRLHTGSSPDGWEVVRIGSHGARGLAAAHLAGLFHRGLQPSDVLLHGLQPHDQLLDAGNGRIAIAGFGLTSDVSGREAVSDVHELPTSPACCSPERLRRKPTDQRSDLYSLGCVLYWAMARRPPFAGEHDDVVRQHLETLPIPLRIAAPNSPPGLDEVVSCLLRKDPQFRYPNAMALLEDLERVSRGGTPNHARQIKSAETSRLSSAAIPAPDEASTQRSTDRIRPPTASSHSWVGKVMMVGVLSAVAVAGYFFYSTRSDSTTEQQDSQPTASAISSTLSSTPTLTTATGDTPESVNPLNVDHIPLPIRPATVATHAPVAEIDGPSRAEIAKARREVEEARIRVLDAKIANHIKSGAHLGPVEDLTAHLGAPDLSENHGEKLWYGHYVFTVSDGLVLGVKQP